MDFNKNNLYKEIKNFNLEELKQLTLFIRNKISNIASTRQIHYASNLGVVELVISIAKVFDLEQDTFLIEGGYASYAYKMITNRMKQIDTLRTTNGIEGYMNHKESKFDKFGSAHLGDTISMVAGLSVETNNYIICVVGDGAISNGEAFEAINNIATLKRKKLIIILNDNDMFISPPVGGISYSLRNNTHLFNSLGYKYIGPVNGNDIPTLINSLETVKKEANDKTVMLHIKTIKGLGEDKAEKDKVGYYHVAGNCKEKQPYSKIIADYLKEKTNIDKSIHVINPAMTVGLNFNEYEKEFPNNYHDVGISEQYAVSYASGLYLANKKPVLAFYSTFLQRSYDQLLQNISRNSFPLLLLSCRADLSPGDGDTHHGIYDLSMLKSIPNTNIVSPRNIDQIHWCIDQGLINKNNEIYTIRIPKVPFVDETVPSKKIIEGQWEWMKDNHKATKCIISYGPYCDLIYQNIKDNNDVDLVNALFVNKYDVSNLEKIFNKYQKIIIYERVYQDVLALDFYKYSNQVSSNIKIISMNFKSFPGMGDQEYVDKKNKMSINDILEKVI